MNSLQNLLQCIQQGSGEITVDADIAKLATTALGRMLNFKQTN